MKFEIKHRFTSSVLFSLETETLKLCLEAAVRSGANLTGAYLAGANLTGAYLAGAYLAGADLAGADLTGANLTGAYLTGAYLAGAYLAGADLTGADLAGADLTGANLAGADYDGKPLIYASVSFTGHGECGRTLTACALKDGVAFWCGCFRGTELELREYIENGGDELKPSRTLALDTVKMLLAQPVRDRR